MPPEVRSLLLAAAGAGVAGILFCHLIAAVWLRSAASDRGVRRSADLPVDVQRSGWNRTARAVALVTAVLFLLIPANGWEPVIIAGSFFIGALLRTGQAHADLA